MSLIEQLREEVFEKLDTMTGLSEAEVSDLIEFIDQGTEAQMLAFLLDSRIFNHIDEATEQILYSRYDSLSEGKAILKLWKKSKVGSPLKAKRKLTKKLHKKAKKK